MVCDVFESVGIAQTKLKILSENKLGPYDKAETSSPQSVQCTIHTHLIFGWMYRCDMLRWYSPVTS